MAVIGFFVEINADASDPDGDDWHLEWGGDYNADSYYPVGNYTVKVRAVDQYGAESAVANKDLRRFGTTRTVNLCPSASKTWRNF